MVGSLLSALLLVGALSPSPAASSARHETPPPVAGAELRVGTELMAIEDVTLDRAIVGRGSRVSVTATEAAGGTLLVDVALPDGHVVHAVPIGEIRRSFRIVD
jgi:hypothetical protein